MNENLASLPWKSVRTKIYIANVGMKISLNQVAFYKRWAIKNEERFDYQVIKKRLSAVKAVNIDRLYFRFEENMYLPEMVL